jgi:hypothetical protein
MTTLPAKTIILQGGSGSVVGTLSASIKTPSPSSLYCKVLTGTIATAPNNTNSNIVMSGFDSNYASANANNNSIVFPPGAYTFVISYVFGMPVTGNGNMYCTHTLFAPSGCTNVPGSNQTTNLSGWAAGNGTVFQSTSLVNVPVGTTGSFTPIFNHSLGTNISNVSVTIGISQTKAY